MKPPSFPAVVPAQPEETDPVLERMGKMPGRKDDGGKRRFSLLPWDAVTQIVDVLEHGAKKYAPENWRKVPDARQRYFDAAQRHLLAWWGGERNDPDSGLHHLAHAGCDVLFLLALDERRGG